MNTESHSLPGPASAEYSTARRNARALVSVEVPLHLNQHVFIPATLVDVSATGFRVRHQSRGVAPGAVLLAWGVVNARVVWTRSTGSTKESGFELLD